jgi:hypothetical protein
MHVWATVLAWTVLLVAVGIVLAALVVEIRENRRAQEREEIAALRRMWEREP